MKIERQEIKSDFVPFVLKLTIETKAEKNVLYSIFNHHLLCKWMEKNGLQKGVDKDIRDALSEDGENCFDYLVSLCKLF